MSCLKGREKMHAQWLVFVRFSSSDVIAARQNESKAS